MTTIPAEQGSFIVSSPDTTLRRRSASSCQPEVTNIWFPVLPGTTDLPISPEPVINENPVAPNSVEAPIGFDPENPDLCALFNDILPISSPPVYPVEQTVELLSAPYIETVLVPTITRTRLGVTSIDYPLSVDGGSVSLLARTRLVLSKFYIAAESAILSFAGNDAIVSNVEIISPILGYFFYSGSAATFEIRPYIIAANVPVSTCYIDARVPQVLIAVNVLIYPPSASISVEGQLCNVAIGAAVLVPAPEAISLSADSPLVRTGSSVSILSPSAIELSTTTPLIATGKSNFVPSANIGVVVLAPIRAGGDLVTIAPPVVAVTVLGESPIISGGKVVAVPVSQISISSYEPEIVNVVYGASVPTIDIGISAINPTVVTGASASAPSSNISIAPETASIAATVPLGVEEVVKIGTASPTLGAGGATHPPVGWNVLLSGDEDDAFVQSTGWTFNFTIDSTAYTAATIGSNTYLLFGGLSTFYTGLSESVPPFSKIHFGSSDNSFQRVYDKAEVIEGVSVHRIRYEGTANFGGDPGSPNIVAEFTFCQPFPDGRQLIELRVGSHQRTSGPFMIASATTAYASSTITENSSWVFIGNSTGTSWTMTSNRFVSFAANKRIQPPSTEITLSSNSPEVEALVPQAIVPVTNIIVSTIEPSLNTNIVVEVPSTDLVVSAELPRIAIDTYFSSLITQVYTWERDFMVDWWAD